MMSALSDSPAAVPLLQLRNVEVIREGLHVLHDVSLDVAAGERIAILGPNGCGKSTFVKLLTRELHPYAKPQSGIKILGRSSWDTNELRRTLGIITNDQRVALDPYASAIDVVASGAFARNTLTWLDPISDELREKSQQALDALEIGDLAERRFSRLSSGQSQRVMIARAFVHEPQTYVLDEPCAALDIGARLSVREAMRTLARQGAGLLLVTHDFDDIVPEIDRVLFMREGRFIADGARTELLQPLALGELFDVSPSIFG
ncbi:MAG: ATP-binding cassette domain-containing protein [Candidatus Velthaea sp.]